MAQVPKVAQVLKDRKDRKDKQEIQVQQVLKVAQVPKVKKKISVSGHTDGQPYVGRRGYGNWELSSDRANAARRTLLAAGYPEKQVARVVGYADSALFDREDPLSPINRRIDIVVLNRHAEEQIMEGADLDTKQVLGQLLKYYDHVEGAVQEY